MEAHEAIGLECVCNLYNRLELVDPLEFVSKNENIDAVNYFDDAVRKVAGSRKVDKLIAAKANSRNRLLYAHDNGIQRAK
jgi:hypothetical protein